MKIEGNSFDETIRNSMKINNNFAKKNIQNNKKKEIPLKNAKIERPMQRQKVVLKQLYSFKI